MEIEGLGVEEEETPGEAVTFTVPVTFREKLTEGVSEGEGEEEGEEEEEEMEEMETWGLPERAGDSVGLAEMVAATTDPVGVVAEEIVPDTVRVQPGVNVGVTLVQEVGLGVPVRDELQVQREYLPGQEALGSGDTDVNRVRLREELNGVSTAQFKAFPRVKLRSRTRRRKHETSLPRKPRHFELD